MSRFAIVELLDELKFSAGHFMVFSSEHRETMHGHDYELNVAFNTWIERNGMSFDCKYYKQKILKICQSLDYRFLLPSQSEYMQLEEAGDQWLLKFPAETISFLKNDVVVLPVSNITMEELSYWFLQQIVIDEDELRSHGIHGVRVQVRNGRGASGATVWGDMYISR